VALDWPSVLTLTTENARQENLLDRFETRGGSVFDIDLGTGYDLVLVTGFLHHFNPETIVGFLRRVHASLKPGGRIVVSDFAPAEDRISPPTAAAFALTMLATTAAGDAYTASEHLDMLSQAGFVRGQVHPLLPSPLSAIVASRD
jgi:2-polyprenyl-3-methyl-5-hydroxy-6-metoxy-1,4-benzoquinol methylase